MNHEIRLKLATEGMDGSRLVNKVQRGFKGAGGDNVMQKQARLLRQKERQFRKETRVFDKTFREEEKLRRREEQGLKEDEKIRRRPAGRPGVDVPGGGALGGRDRYGRVG
ncbi:unnamed protein product, partial [marine sediment metagenome]